MQKRVYNKSTGRDYSYDKEYESSDEQKKRRAKRNKDRRQAERDGKVSKGDGKDIHHQGKGSLTKPIVRDRSKNRGDH